MPFGLTNAPRVLVLPVAISFVAVYFNDVFIHLKTVGETFDNVKSVTQFSGEGGLNLSISFIADVD